MMDRQAFRRKFLLRLASSPVTLIPSLGGLTALVAAWTFDLSALVAFGSIAAILIGVGTFLTRWATGTDHVAKAALADLEREVAGERERALDALEHRLVRETTETRDEDLLRDLRELQGAFRESRGWWEGTNPHTLLQILGSVEELFTSCVRLLERSLELASRAAKLRTRATKLELAKRRTEMLNEVERSVKKLGEILAGVESLATKSRDDGADQVRRLREELDQHLEIARRVEERMRGFTGNDRVLERE